MRKLLSLFFVLSIVIVHAQAPNWTPDASQFSNSMVMVGELRVNGEASTDPADILGAFVDNEVRGVASPIFDEDVNRYLIFLIVFGDVDGEAVTFQIFDDSEDEVFAAVDTVGFEVNATIGDVSDLFFWSNTILNSEAALSAFTIASQEGTTTIAGTDVTLTMPYDTDLSALVAEFELSAGAGATVDDAAQISGVTPNDFSNPLTYVILSEDESQSTAYTVTVTEASAKVTDIVLSDTAFFENVDVGTVIGTFTATDADNTSHLFTFTQLPDTTTFSIDDQGQLLTKRIFDFESEPDSIFDIEVQAADSAGNTLKRAFELNLLNVNEAPVLLSSTPNQNVLSGTNWQIELDLPALFSDPDGDSLAFEIVPSDTLIAVSIDTIAVATISPIDSAYTGFFTVEVFAKDASLSASDEFEVFSGPLNGGLAPTAILISNNVLPENSGSDFVVGELSALDLDDAKHTFSIEFQPDTTVFMIDGNNLIALRNLDFEQEVFQEFDLLIRAEDDEGNDLIEVITINLQDVNEAPQAVNPLGTLQVTFSRSTWSTDLDIADVFADPDADSLTLSLDIVDRQSNPVDSLNLPDPEQDSIHVTIDNLGLGRYSLSSDRFTGDLELLVVASDSQFTVVDTVLLRVEVALSFDQLDSHDLEVYPNPVEDQLNIRMSNLTARIVDLGLFDLEGRLLKRVHRPIQSAENVFAVDIGHLKPGLYILRIAGENFSTSHYVLKR